MENTQPFDVIIIGGSYAGLSAAMALGRSVRRVLVIDAGLPCNRHVARAHNFLTRDGEPPQDIAATARKQVLAYGSVELCEDFALSGKKTGVGFEVKTKSGKTFHGKLLIFATGIIELMPTISGFAECWGISMIHCPYCHGYEFRDKATGIMANGKRALHLAGLVHNLTKNLRILTTGEPDFEPEELKKLRENKIDILPAEIEKISHQDGMMERIHFSDGSSEVFDAVYAVIPFTQQSDIPASLGCEITEHGYLKIDEFQKTTVEGVLACGDNSSHMRSIASAVSSGNMAGALANKMLADAVF